MHTFNEPTITYGVGRFVVDIPAPMKFGGGYSMRTFSLKEMVWKAESASEQAQDGWNNRIADINNMNPPEGIKNALIETSHINGIGKGFDLAFFYKDSLRPNRGYLDALLSTDTTGLWITAFGKATGKDFMYAKSTDLARAYRPPTRRLGRATVLKGRDAFYLRYGAIDLPFEYKESVDIEFSGHPIDEKLLICIKTKVIDKENKTGLLERAANSMYMKLVPNLKIEKLRSGKRTVAGMQGEELIERFTDDGQNSLSFLWMSLGKRDSAHFPKTIMDMQSSDGHLEEKLALWDAILDSMRPAGR